MNTITTTNNAKYRQILNKYIKKNINNMNKNNLALLAYCWNYYVKIPKFEKINGIINRKYYLRKWRNKYYFELRK